ncbi:TonB-dependent receptor [Marinimicrobium sp. LS-A18]|uniref:TonB-dependent receptor n=1 Tax=Marinimicrobium sp. LS-A18 TaxID=1381596 RepID=UPI0004B4EDDC|nr:TonB-dependent receptor [Marinimicrobium sp. LS-A18]
MQKSWLQWSGIGLLWAGLVSPSALAETLTGAVLDADGQPVAGAVVEWVGSNRQALTDAAGRFSLEDLRGEEVELHIMAPRFVHQQLHVDLDEGPVTIRLRPTRIEVIEVVALPWHASTLESAQPVNVIAGDTLARQQSSTLGETLKNEVGVHTNYFGPVASSPVIRGLSGPRVLITQNGLDAGDVSRVGPDHLVTTETSTAEQVEVLRGPATLFYGSGAIGGVVNIVDGRVPTDNQLAGQWHLKHDNVADEKLVSASVTGGTGSWATHVDGFWRESNDYRIPVAAERETHDADHDHEHEHTDEVFDGRLDNSAYRAKGANVGASYLLDNGFVGVSVGRLERTYGIPGHSHESHDGEGDVDVYADLEQDRVQLISELSLDHAWFSALNTRLGYTDYRHSEIEEGVPLTTFANTSREVRAELFHHPVAEWRGAWSLQYKHQDFSAEGAEAFTPPSETESLALGWMEERHFGPVQVQLGARVERVELSADQVTVPMDDQPGLLAAYQVKQTFEPFSLSAGAVWDFTEGYNLGLSLSRAQRAPSAAELYSFGPHIGTSSYEIGALYDLHEEADGHFHAEVSPAAVELETSNNIDLTLRKFEGDVGFTLNAFYNQMDDFYYLSATGLEAEDDHADEHDHGEAEHEEEEALPVYHYTARDARLYGVEGQLVWQVASPWRLTLMSDYTRATLNGGEAMPRIPPLRLGAQLEYRLNGWRAELGAQHYFDQDRTANLETESDGYTLVDAQLSYDWEWAAQTMTFYVQGNNLTDTEARPHTSFLKDKAPLPARSLAVGLRSRF